MEVPVVYHRLRPIPGKVGTKEGGMMRKISLAMAVVLGMALPLFAQGYFEVVQGTTKVAVTPLVGTQPAQNFYDYDSGQSRSRNPLGEANTAVLFLYREPAGQLYLFFILGKAS